MWQNKSSYMLWYIISMQVSVISKGWFVTVIICMIQTKLKAKQTFTLFSSHDVILFYKSQRTWHHNHKNTHIPTHIQTCKQVPVYSHFIAEHQLALCPLTGTGAWILHSQMTFLSQQWEVFTLLYRFLTQMNGHNQHVCSNFSTIWINTSIQHYSSKTQLCSCYYILHSGWKFIWLISIYILDNKYNIF